MILSNIMTNTTNKSAQNSMAFQFNRFFTPMNMINAMGTKIAKTADTDM
jgi:hypothetical protein